MVKQSTLIVSVNRQMIVKYLVQVCPIKFCLLGYYALNRSKVTDKDSHNSVHLENKHGLL